MGSPARKTSVTQSYLEISNFVRARYLLPRPRAFINRQCYHCNGTSLRSFVTTPRLQSDAQNTKDDFLRKYKSSISFPIASKDIAQLSKANVGQQVTLHGYLGSRVDLSKKLSFAPLLSKEASHSVQIISIAKSSSGSVNEAHSTLKSLSQHTPVAIVGLIKERQPSKNDRTGNAQRINDVEIDLKEIIPLNDFPTDLEMTETTNFTPEQRHLQLRNTKSLRDALAFRSKAAAVCRTELNWQGFLEIETPLLFKSTPEGAREFLVPTREKGLVYALPQSPQQYKQILMASGIPKYYQMAKCFRDEDQRADRQPEFTQLDMEMSFAKGEQVMEVIEGLICSLWKEMKGEEVQLPIQRMSYHEAMAKYGSDKPDLRFGSEISEISNILPADLISKISPLTNPNVDVFKIKAFDHPQEARGFVSQFLDSNAKGAPFIANPDGQPGIFIFDSRKPLQGLMPFGFQTAEFVEEKLELEDGDIVVLQARKKAPFTGGFTMAGRLRLALYHAAVEQGVLPMPQENKFLWITDFPLFTPDNDSDPGQGGSAGFSSTHHPFTSPKTPEDVDLLASDPAAVKADHYDIVLNGVELGGGSRRVHDARVQEYILRDILKMPNERLADFAHLLDVLRAGCPPHAGIALGFDRLIATMLHKDSIRDVIAFPKTGSGEDMLVKSPSRVTEGQLDTYHLRLKE